MPCLGIAIRSRRFALVALTMVPLWTAAAEAAEGAPACTNLPPSDLKVLVFHREARTVSVGPDDLRRLADEARTSTTIQQLHPLMLSAATLSAHVTVDERAVQVAEDTFCAAPRSVSIGVGFPERIVYIADAAAAQPCIRQELLDHDEKHARVDDEALVAFLARTEESLYQVLATLKHQPAPTAHMAVERFDAGLKAFLDTAMAAFDEDRTRLQSMIDAPEEMEQLRNACGGGVRRLEDAPTNGARRT